MKLRVHEEGVAVVTLDAPPGNVLSSGVRAGLWEVFGRLCARDNIRAIVLQALGGRFSAGVDIATPDLFATAADLAQLCLRIEECPKPVIAALEGAATGAGADLALACHYRIAAPDASLAWPEVRLGLLPLAGGVQRLTRCVGAGAAVAILTGGQKVPANLGQRTGLIDGIARGDLASDAVTFARKGDLIARPAGARRDRLRDGRAHLAAVAKARAQFAGSQRTAPARIVDCVEVAGLLPYEAGLAFEADALAQAFADPQSTALIHAHLAERRVPERLMVHGAEGWHLTEGGEVLAARLHDAWIGAASALAARGTPRSALDAAATEFGFAHGPFGTVGEGAASADLVRRLVAALLVEAAAILADHPGLRPRDLDAVALHGIGFPRHRGGPFRAAQTMGLLGLRSDMRGWAAEDLRWTPPGILDEAIKDARGFDAL